MNISMQKVLEYIKEHPVCSYKEISDATGEQVTMVSSCIRLLVERNHIIRHKNFNKTGGAMKNRYQVV